MEELFAEEPDWDSSDYQWDAHRLQVSKSGKRFSSCAASASFGRAWLTFLPYAAQQTRHPRKSRSSVVPQ